MKKLTNFFNCAANGLPKTGGGNSQTRGHQLGVASVITSTLSRFDCVSLASRLRVLDYTRGISALFSSRVYRYVAVLLMVFMVGIGQMWGTDRYIFGKTAVSSTGTLSTSSSKIMMVRTTDAGTTYRNVNEFFSYDANVPTSGGNVYMKDNAATTNSSSAQLQVVKWKKNCTTALSWANTKLRINDIKIYAYEGSSKAIKLTISNGTTSKEYTIQKKAGSSQTILPVIEIDDVIYTSTTGISITVDNNEDLHALMFFEAEEYVEITNGDTQAFQGESIPMKANVAGGEWSVTGDATINPSTGVLAVNADATGTIVVTYTKGTKSDTRNIAVQSGTTKSVTWNFATLTGGAVYACGVQSTIAASDVSYEGGYVNMVNNYVGVDVSSTGYKITAASFNVKTPSGGSKKIDYDYLTTGSKSAAGTYTTTSANYEDGEVASIDNKTAFRLWKNSTTTQVKSITLTLKREGASCTTPTIAWATGSTDNISVVNELSATDLEIDVAEYTGDVTWTLTGDDIVALSNQANDGCTITGKSDAYGTATLTASFTVAAGGDLCPDTYSISKTITIIECNEPTTITDEIARFFVPCGTSGIYNVTNQASSTEVNTYSTSDFGGTWDFKAATGLSYGKLNSNDAYISIKLNTGDFQAGDVVKGYFSSNNDNNNLKLHSTSGNALGSASASGFSGEYVRSLTLAAADIEEDGSIKFFRVNSGIRVNRIITREPPCVGDPGDISKGTLSAGVLTLNAAGSPVSGDTWYWQSSSTGTDQTNSGTSYGVSAAGTYYVRSYNATGTCWSDAKSFTVTAEDLVESFTVVFKDGETTLGSETVEVGKHPSAAGISTTKEFYTFAAWQLSGVDKALNTVSAANGETVTLSARYTGNYAYGTYLFNSLTMGTTISKTITTSEDTYADAFRVDNFYFAAGIKIQGEVGTAEETTTLTNYKGWKLKTNAKTIRFLVENNSQVKVAIGEKTGIQVTYTPLVGAETTASQAKDNETAYSVKGGTVVTITTTSDNTTTLKRLSISNLYNVTYTDGTGDASGSASNVTEVTLPTPTETIVTVETVDYSFTGWKANQIVKVNDVEQSVGTLLKAGDVAVLGANTTFTAQWAVVVPKYTITKGLHTNGDFTIDPAEQEAGGAVTLTATPNEDYVFSAWAVVKTEDGSATGITVSNNAFMMPAYGVTVNATFAADPRQKVLYVTSNSESDTKASDKVYAALKDTYNVKIVGPSSDADQSGYDLIVLHESVGGGDNGATAIAAAKTGNTPVLNTKSYFYGADKDASKRWQWGAPNAGQSVKGATLNSAYCNIADHPLFSGVTVTDGFFEITDEAADKCMQPVGSFTSGKEGYTLATTPNTATPGGNGAAIHELTPTQRGASAGKYLLISVSSAKLDALNTNGQKLFQNAAAYLIGNTAWEPVNALSSPAVTASPSAAYSVGDNIALTASATGSSAATTYTWYKGDTWAAAEEAGAIQAAATAAAGGNTYGITGCALGDAGTYWCVISNGTGCEVSASLAITVSDISYDIAFVSAHGTAPTATTGVSYTLPELSADGWEHQGWTANINVEVDAETVTAGTTIANGKIATFGADVEFTAVWAEVFDVTFNMQSHGASIAAQHIVDGGKATEPNDPSAIGWDFGGWFTDAECTAGNEFDFNTTISADTELFAKWTAFTGCTELWPATSGDAPATVGDAIVMQTGSKGAAMTVVAKPDKLEYTSSGLQFGSESGVKVNVVLNNDMTVGTKISLTLVAGGTSARGLDLYNAAGSAKIATLGWSSATNGEEKTFTYTVVAEDGLDEAHEFQLWRNNTVYLKSLKVESCGDAIIYHDLTSAISPDHDPAYATVTLGASSVREGRTTTAEYSAINAAYEFDEWQISGTGASIADASANPAVITMGTADAVVTLKLKAATPKHTVTFNKMGKGDDIASQSVKEGDLIEEPTVTEPEGWILEGWYTENTFDTKWDFANDVMSTSDIELFANWVADTSIKLINKSTGAINTTNFTTAVAAEADVDGEKGAVFNANRDAITSVSALNEMVQYNATTNQTKIQLSMYNTSSNEKTIHLFKVAEGDDAATVIDITIDGNSRLTTEYYTFNSDKNRSFYVTVSDKKVQILQMRVVEDGTAIKQFGQAGYSFNMNKGRIFAKSGNAVNFEGASITTNSDYKVLNNSSLSTNSYIRFTTTVDGMILKVTRSGGNYYVSQDPENKGTSYSKNEEVVLATAGTWYIGSTSSGSSASFTKFEFIAPKCETPAFNALANSDICSGDAYVALDGTGTVSDGGSISYKWYAQGSEDVLGTNATYTPETDGNYFVVALHHVDGYTDNEATSAVVTVTTHAGTAITEGLAHVRKTVGEAATLTVEATGKNLHYVWKECATIDGSYTDVAGAPDNKSLDIVVPDGVKYYKVIVSSGCGADQESIAKVEKFIPVAQVVVSNSVVWDLTTCADAQIQLDGTTSPKKGEECLMANIEGVHMDENFHSESLVMSGEYIYRNVTGKPTCAEYMKFETSVPGLVRVHFAGNGDNRCLRITSSDNVQYSSVSTGTGNDLTEDFEVAAGVIELMGLNGDHTGNKKYMRFFQIEFYALDKVRDDSWIAPRELGTVCYPNGHIVVGADMYQMAGVNENGKFAFDQVQKTEPGVPYLFEATGYDPIKFYKTTAAAAEEAGTSNGMVGTFVQMTLSPATDVNAYYFQGTHFYAVADRTKDLTVPANRCYVDLTEPHAAAAPRAGVRRITFGVNGTNGATGFENIKALDGRVQKVLIDGKIYILRGEKMYDATGRLVK